MKLFERLLKITFFSISLICISFCSKSENPAEKDLLARVGDKTISVNEFIQRAEYTIRPSYCKGNSNVHKKIVLNSLIGEKLLALEAGNNNKLSQN